MAILKSQGLMRKKGTTADLVRMFGGRKNIRVHDRRTTGVDGNRRDP